jgi:hypothetical protein
MSVYPSPSHIATTASTPASASTPTRVIRSDATKQADMAHDARTFQASGAFVAACQDATLALHALTAQIKALQMSLPKEKTLDAAVKTTQRKTPRRKNA